MDHKYLQRQSDIIPTEILSAPITVIGVGAIGSVSVLTLAKMGFENIAVIDFDKVDEVNMNSQYFFLHQIGLPKVKALAEVVGDFTGTNLITHDEKYENGAFKGIVISAVDNMATRQLIWDEQLKAASFGGAADFVIDPRMGAENCLMYCMAPLDKDDQNDYQKTLYTDEAAAQDPCTAKATMYTSGILGSMVAKAVKSVLLKENYPRILMWNIKENDFGTTFSKKLVE